VYGAGTIEDLPSLVHGDDTPKYAYPPHTPQPQQPPPPVVPLYPEHQPLSPLAALARMEQAKKLYQQQQEQPQKEQKQQKQEHKSPWTCDCWCAEDARAPCNHHFGIVLNYDVCTHQCQNLGYIPCKCE
jgi:hypothetical protein